MRGVFLLLLIIVKLAFAAPPLPSHNHKVYEKGQEIPFECKSSKGEWGPPPICQETGSPLSLVYGVDKFYSCGFLLDSQDKFDYFSAVVSQTEQITCRVPVMPEEKFYVPFNIPLWGVAEGEHMHIGNHMNIIFHAHTGRIIGVAAYPVSDRWQYVELGSLASIHGPVKWFKAHSFQDLSGISLPFLNEDSNVMFMVVWICISILVSLVCSGIFYRYYLKPNLVKKYLKKD
eukprot:TRINITY_DN6994_c0_g1_i1.p1 TRINITY_DN6994_c0_g1~~TRINITY_DN6994_c0_g1_i1.p1  ORF type:complete len:231 (-),score=30.52 TRINITY_DN6994_c0_g1_i1:28-720(-)